jgi:hypothetical protein
LMDSRTASGWELAARGITIWLQDWNFQSHFNSLPDLQGREKELKAELISKGQWFNQSYLQNEVFIKVRGLESFQITEHVEALGRWCAKEGYGSSIPLPVDLAYGISSIWLFIGILCSILLKKWENVFLWVLWVILAH